MKVEFYYKGKLSDFSELKRRLKELLKSRIPRYEINYIEIKDDSSASRYRVPGIPTIKFNGRDIEESKRFVKDFNCQPRIYIDCSGSESSIPTEALLKQAIQEYIEDSATFHMEVKGKKKGNTPIC